MKTLYLGIGNNIGNRIKTINQAIRLLKREGKIVNSSFLYETSPMIMTNQPSFLNAVLKYKTNLSPQEALDFFEHIERVHTKIKNKLKKISFKQN
jgi:2-amino-4-hydroxy-6-hydroxymethyldihydropteridine diphosphokinase